MSISQIFVAIFAIVSVGLSVLAVWRVAKASGARYKPLWIVGCLFGFVGFATNFSSPGDLYLQFGIQIPVLVMVTTGSGDILPQALFPIVAAVALVKFHRPSSRPDE